MSRGNENENGCAAAGFVVSDSDCSSNNWIIIRCKAWLQRLMWKYYRSLPLWNIRGEMWLGQRLSAELHCHWITPWCQHSCCECISEGGHTGCHNSSGLWLLRRARVGWLLRPGDRTGWKQLIHILWLPQQIHSFGLRHHGLCDGS